MRLRGLDLAAGLAFLVLIGLGTWQVTRRAEKLDFIANYEAGLHARPQVFPAAWAWPSTDFSTLEYRRVEIEGHFMPLPEVHLYALLLQKAQRYGGIGWWVFMPFELKGGGVVFVNRGFVPHEQKYPAQRPKSLAPRGTQILEGLVRLPEKPGMFTPPNEPRKNEWYLRDPLAFAEYESLEKANVAPVAIDQLNPNEEGLPQASDGILHIANNHLEYAITWFALALVLLVIYVMLRRRQNTDAAEH